MTRLAPIMAALSLALTLSACGADGEPTRPEARPAPGLSVTGSVGVGISGSN